MVKNFFLPLFFLSFLSFTLHSCLYQTDAKKSTFLQVESYLTIPDQKIKFQPQTNATASTITKDAFEINIDESTVFQEMDGFGFTLTGGSAQHLYNMSDMARTNLLNELFSSEGQGIGISYLRISIGASDLDSKVFSYNDLPIGAEDIDQENFSILPDRTFLIPILKEILGVNPNLKIMASPWSPPIWMKSNGSTKGGTLLPKYYDSYARYFVKYIQTMALEGIIIDAITIQNEPLHPGNNPSMKMSARQQGDFIKQSLGPVFDENDIKTKIVLYDHNADRPDYPIQILDDPEIKKYVDGSAFHLYGGHIQNLSQVHQAHPDKNLYFTEQWIGSPPNFGSDLKWHTREVIIGASRNWCRVVLEWNLAADPDLKPHTDGGCTKCLGALTIEGDRVRRNPAFYIIAHASKFVRPGARRIASNVNTDLPNVAFLCGDKIVLIVLNNSESVQNFNIKKDQNEFSSHLPAGAVATYIW